METTQDALTNGQTEGVSEQITEGALVLQERLSQLNEKALEVIKERPGACLLGAVALGFIVGKIASRY